ncbi:MAG: tyrosine-type recombinase/integrase [Defluviitaleaceae bacterium]|nr:tyrosine-type recombinase/integrase [Defluviitaleaceae bacterium]MCL2261752.1 tyrosine-type recombinase/integrase [Defluviitaleaceae bacterium]
MALTEPIRDPKQVRAFLAYYRNLGQTRNQVLVTIALHTALRISDILRLRTCDVYDFTNRRARTSITITERKTGKSKIIALHKNIIRALEAYFSQATPNAPLILNLSTNNPISRVHAYRLISEAANAIGVIHKVGCHSLRKTFGYHSWTSGISPVVIMEIYNHNSYAVTKRYLGVSQDDKNAVYEKLDF